MRLLIIGPLSGGLATAARLAAEAGAGIEQADGTISGLDLLRGRPGIDLVICDIGQDIAALLMQLRAERIGVPLIAAGTDQDAEAARAAIIAGAREYLPLPPDADLIAAILEAVASEPEPAMIAEDPAMRRCIARASQLAKSNASVLVTGESGTGKEVIARHIHRVSRRAKGPFIAVNCAAIPEQLIESELFGHEKGAFSGAAARRVGKFEAADGGTLLLDEIGELDFRLQAKLLRALQERAIDRIGGNRPIPVDVRILAATNRDLAEEIAGGRFREDLFFRLNVLSIHLPALRERRSDIAPLARHFLGHYAALNGLAELAIDETALQRLGAHAWRGNVRELENVMHRAVLLATGARITAADLELGAAAENRAAVTPPAGDAAAPASDTSVAALVGQRMDEVEQALILETLNHCLGNRTRAASILGISIRALRNKLRDYAARGVTVAAPHTGIAA